jgi:DNA-directed RNA polymerase specialized sigma24 family protein
MFKIKTKQGGVDMTQEQLLRHLDYCKWRWNGYGEDVFQEACLLALKRYKTLENINQNLFGLLCREAARNLLKHKKFEITFSQITQSYFDEKNFEDTLADPRSNDAWDALTDDYDFEEVHNDDFVSFTEEKQLPPFQLPLPFFTNL